MPEMLQQGVWFRIFRHSASLIGKGACVPALTHLE